MLNKFPKKNLIGILYNEIKKKLFEVISNYLMIKIISAKISIKILIIKDAIDSVQNE